ncbi:MAG: type II secretion system F family protein [Elusimicrobia bacterium]|nr:type II secretion system F family protein [Elusimicrobiota bacterium]
MGQFNYKVKAPSGGISTGLLEASDLRMAMEKLHAQKFIVLEINEVKKRGLTSLMNLLPFGKGVPAKDLCLFSRQLSTLVSSGVPIVQGLSILEEQAENKNFKKVISKIREDIESGISIADAMKKHPAAFSELYISMVKAGEIGGILDIILDRLSSYLESSEELKGKIKGAMMYPIVVACIAVGASAFMLIVVIPKFSAIFGEMGVKLPLPTRVLLALSSFLQKYLMILILFGIGGFIGFKQGIKRSRNFALKVDNLKINIPVFGIMIRKMSIAKFTSTLGTLVKSGVPILQALETVAKTSGNLVIENALLSAKEAIREGERITEPLKRSKIFPPMVIQMISVGEETGTLDMMLTKIASFYDREVDDAVKGMTSMIEPLIIVFMGGVIGGMVLAMFLPMLELTSQMSKG